MANVATVSCKLSPEHYTVLRLIAEGQNSNVSELVRRAVIDTYDLQAHTERLAVLMNGDPLTPA